MSATVSALTSTKPRRARGGVVVAGGLPGKKITDVLPFFSVKSWVTDELWGTHEAAPLVTVVVVVEVLVKSQAAGKMHIVRSGMFTWWSR